MPLPAISTGTIARSSTRSKGRRFCLRRGGLHLEPPSRRCPIRRPPHRGWLAFQSPDRADGKASRGTQQILTICCPYEVNSIGLTCKARSIVALARGAAQDCTFPRRPRCTANSRTGPLHDISRITNRGTLDPLAASWRRRLTCSVRHGHSATTPARAPCRSASSATGSTELSSPVSA